jgi:RHS repeat-associated protein
MSRFLVPTTLRALLCGGVALALTVGSGHMPIGAEPQTGSAPTGQSVTPLPDGRRLLIGGDASPGAVAIEDPHTGATQRLAVSPGLPRAWHSATLLGDGTVLIAGGVDANGRTISAPERFNLTTRSFEPLPWDGFARRARHTATLLSDGRVLIAGGQTAGGSGDAEVWNPQTQSATRLTAPMIEERIGHTATLQADGRVRFEGGSGSGNVETTPELFDPVTNAFSRGTAAVSDGEAPRVVWSDPSPGQTDVPSNVRLTLRFSGPMSSASVSPETVSLVGPEGPVDVAVVPAERGVLAFVTPLTGLTPGSRYTLAVDGPTSTSARRQVRRFTMAFSTAQRETPKDVEREPEDWSPDPANLRRWRTDRAESPWRMLPPLTARPGVTALAGQALTLSGGPLADVSLTVKGRTTRTDKTGRFLLELDQIVGGRHQLEIEGATASRPGRTYGFFEAGISLTPGTTSVLPYTIWMPAIDTARSIRIASPTGADVVVTTPKIPGLELHLPRGSVIKDRQGKIVREISITPIPVDRTPFPLPKHISVPVYFTIQPGGAYVYSAGYQPKKARLIYPNYYDTPKGVVANFWQYDPEELDWYVYGAGKVTGKQVVPDPGVGLYEFTGAMMDTFNTPPGVKPAPGGGPAAGDPVDVATGLLTVGKTDLFLPDVIPITLSRTYRPLDPVSRAFGIGTTHPYAMRLWSAQNYQQADLILPDGGRIHYVRTSPGTGFSSAVYEHTATPTGFYKSRLAWNGDGWDVTLRDGTVYTFGDFAPLQAIRDRFGNTVTIEHANGQSGNVTRVVSQNGRWITFTYDGSNRITQAADNIGRTVGYQYDASGRLWKVTDPGGGVTEYTYDSSHRLLTIKDPRNIVFQTNTYDANGRVTTQTQADGTTWEFDYTLDSNGKVTQADVTDPRGHITRTTFNSSQYALTSTEALGLPEERTTTFARDSTSNLVTRIVDPLNRRTDFTYDADGQVTAVTRLAGTADAVTSTYTYESKYSLPATVTDSLSHTTTFTYDSAGHLTTVTDPLGHDVTFTYNAAGQPLTVTNDAIETTQLGYERGDLVSVTNPLGQSSTQYFDAAGRLLRVLDPLGRATAYEYGLLNQTAKVINPLGGETTFTYDGNGNLLTLTDARGKTTTWTYDNMDQVSTRTDPLSRAESFAYHENGAIKTWTDRKGQVTSFSYDALDRPTFVGYGTTGTPPTYASTVTTAYDAGDRPTSVVDSVAGTLTPTFDLLDRLTQEASPEGTITYTYDAADRRATMQVAGQAAVSYTYDNADRLTGLTKGTASVTMAYDAVDRRTSLSLPNGIVVESSYDAASQLTGLAYKLGDSTLGALDYTYDGSGQRTALGGTYARTGLPAALGSATYDDANQIATFGGTSFSYDANGNLTSDGTNTYCWNARNQLSGISGGVSASFGYDAMGRRRAKTIGGASTQFLYDGLNPVQELASGTPTANLMTGFRLDEYFMRTDASGARNVLTDAQGSSVALTDGSGIVQAEYTYEAFGKTTTSGAPGTNAFGFTGREADGTGLHFYRARYYDARLQRFIGEDPLGFDAGDVNFHAYVGNAPGDFTDPTGQMAGIVLPLAGCVGGAIGKPLGKALTGRKVEPIDFLDGCLMGIPFGLPGAGPWMPRGLPPPGVGPGRPTGPPRSPRPSPRFKAPTNPPQVPPKKIPEGWRVREMPPTEQYPDGYWKMEKPLGNGKWQPIDPSTMKPGGRPETHIPFPPRGGE